MAFYIDKFDIERSAVPRDCNQGVYYTFFSRNNVAYISNEITNRLAGVHPDNKNIIVPNEQIISVMDSIYTNTFRDVDKMTMMAISYITDYIRTEYQMEQQNQKLNNWVINFRPEFGLRQYSKIKLREKRPIPMLFNYNY